METALLDFWNFQPGQASEVQAQLQVKSAQTPWFCLPKMLQARLSQDALDLMEASLYAPDRARLHEWREIPPNIPQPAREVKNPQATSFSVLEFLPPQARDPFLPYAGTGPLDTKVQLIASSQRHLTGQLRQELAAWAAEQVPRPAPGSVPTEKASPLTDPSSSEIAEPAPPPASKPKKIVPDEDGREMTTPPALEPPAEEGIIYQGNDGHRIPIAISEEEFAAFFAPKPGFVLQSQEPEAADSEFELKAVEELIGVEADAAIEESISQDLPPATETMAKLLVLQGDKAGAIEIYERLRLANPEKSAYFVGQIEQLQQQL